MPQSHARIILHYVFSTKHRRPFIDQPMQAQLWPYLATAIRNQGCNCLIVGGRPEHVHVLVRMSSTLLVGQGQGARLS